MCGICGCSETVEDEKNNPLQHSHAEDHLIHIEMDLFAKNNQFAANNRAYFHQKNITALNIMSSPGSGKTTLLGKTITDLKQQQNMAVIVGDQQTDYDAALIQKHGAQAVQINTGHVCHLDAHRIGHALSDISLTEQFILFIENIGNLVCPSAFDLGEKYKIVMLSVTEGDNKPIKYPDMFRKADLVLITKMDLLPYVNFDFTQCKTFVQRINPRAQIMPVSITTGEGLNDWYQWLRNAHEPIGSN